MEGRRESWDLVAAIISKPRVDVLRLTAQPGRKSGLTVHNWATRSPESLVYNFPFHMKKSSQGWEAQRGPALMSKGLGFYCLLTCLLDTGPGGGSLTSPNLSLLICKRKDVLSTSGLQ